jgi:hypothetical protein
MQGTTGPNEPNPERKAFIETEPGHVGPAGETSSGGHHGARERLSEVAHEARLRSEHLAEAISEGMRRARHSAEHYGEDIGYRARRAGRRVGTYSRRASGSVAETVREQPLVLLALGIAVGAAVAALVPRGHRESEAMGRVRRRVSARARDFADEQLDRVERVAEAAADAARRTAEEQGLTPEGIRARAEEARRAVRDVAAAATEAAREEMEHEDR